MSGSPLNGTNAALGNDDIAQLVEQAAAARGKVAERIIYLEALDSFAMQSGRLALLIERDFIDEFRELPAKAMSQVTLSPSGPRSSSRNTIFASRQPRC